MTIPSWEARGIPHGSRNPRASSGYGPGFHKKFILDEGGLRFGEELRLGPRRPGVLQRAERLRRSHERK